MKTKDFGRIISTGPKLGDRQIRVRAASGRRDRVGDELVVGGIDLASYRANPIVLAEHDRTAPIGTASDIVVKGDALECVITFAPLGASEKADEYCALAKSSVIGGISVGFLEKESTPIKGGGYRISKSELLEIGLVAVPCNAEATVMERSMKSRGVFMPRGVKPDHRAKRLRQTEVLAMKHARETLSRAERDAEVRRLKSKGVTPVADLAGPAFAHAKAADIAADNLARSAAAFSKAPPSEAQRLGDLERLR